MQLDAPSGQAGDRLGDAKRVPPTEERPANGFIGAVDRDIQRAQALTHNSIELLLPQIREGDVVAL